MTQSYPFYLWTTKPCTGSNKALHLRYFEISGNSVWINKAMYACLNGKSVFPTLPQPHFCWPKPCEHWESQRKQIIAVFEVRNWSKFKTYTHTWISEDKPINGSLGYLVGREAVYKSSIFIVNNFFYHILRYGSFSCPDMAIKYIKAGMKPRCFLLKPAFLQKNSPGSRLSRSNQCSLFGSIRGILGDFIVSPPGYCGTDA